MDWVYKGKKVVNLPEGTEAFVYLLVFQDGTKYIGKKNTTSTRRVKVKGRVRRKVVTTESNWREYLSSSKVVKSKIEAGDKLASKEVLHMCSTKGQATYLEVYEMFLRDVLCDSLYLNLNILSRFFKCYKDL